MKKFLLVFTLAIPTLSTAMGPSVYVKKLTVDCLNTMVALSNDPEVSKINKMIITKPNYETSANGLSSTQLLVGINSGVQVKAYQFESESTYKFESPENYKKNRGVIIEKDNYSGTRTREMSLEKLTKILIKNSPSAHRIDVAVEYETGHVYVLEVYGVNEFTLRNLTTQSLYSLKIENIRRANEHGVELNAVNIVFSKNNQTSILTISFMDPFNLSIIGLGQTLFEINQTKVESL